MLSRSQISETVFRPSAAFLSELVVHGSFGATQVHLYYGTDHIDAQLGYPQATQTVCQQSIVISIALGVGASLLSSHRIHHQTAHDVVVECDEQAALGTSQ